MYLKVILVLIFLLGLSHAAPESNPEAIPLADPEAIPEAESKPDAIPEAESDPEAESQPESIPEAGAQWAGGQWGSEYNPGQQGGSGFNPGGSPIYPLYPGDGSQGYNPGGGGGYNPGGGGGYNPGGDGGQGYNPGGDGGQGYNPGSDTDQGFNPGGSSVTPIIPGEDGGQGYNPGTGGDQGYNPGIDGGQGYNPGGSGFITPVYNPRYTIQGTGGSGYNPGSGIGGSGYNPGSGIGGSGYNPGSGSGGSGYNPGFGSGDQGYSSGSGGWGFNPGQIQAGQTSCPQDQCCGMVDNNCCLGGQQCYTYYEQVCDNKNKPRCQVQSKEFCKSTTVPFCRVIREQGETSMDTERCLKMPKRECFKYTREICNSYPEPFMYDVQWNNDKLEQVSSETDSKCEEVDACNMVEEVKEETTIETKRVCNETRVEVKQECQMVFDQGQPQVVQQIQYRVEYRRRCYNVPKQVCQSQPCTSNGCLDGSSVCSASNYIYQQRCAKLLPYGGLDPRRMGVAPGMGGMGPGMGGVGSCGEIRKQNLQRPPAGCGSGSPRPSICQSVKEAACYGPVGSCDAPSQQCCTIQMQRVCKQVPERVPVPINTTIPGQAIPRQDCHIRNITVPVCKDYQVSVTANKTSMRCDMQKEEKCVNFTLPVFEIVKVPKSEQVDLRNTKCKKTTIDQEYCHTFPDAKVECHQKTEKRRYIINKVVCDRNRDIKICRNIPWSSCVQGSQQECRMVRRQRCVDSCSNNPACSRCDQMRQAGQLQSTCPYSQSSPWQQGQGQQGQPWPQGQGQHGQSWPQGQGQQWSQGPSCGNFYPQDMTGNTVISNPAVVTSTAFEPIVELAENVFE